MGAREEGEITEIQVRALLQCESFFLIAAFSLGLHSVLVKSVLVAMGISLIYQFMHFNILHCVSFLQNAAL